MEVKLASSHTSRKNKLQRCSACGNLGHKSRTCPNTNQTQTQNATQRIPNFADAVRRAAQSQTPNPPPETKITLQQVAALSLLQLAGVHVNYPANQNMNTKRPPANAPLADEKPPQKLKSNRVLFDKPMEPNSHCKTVYRRPECDVPPLTVGQALIA